MTTVETIILLIIGIITLPYICKKIRRESLLFCSYLLFGLGIGDFLQPHTLLILYELGEVGFILLLFLIGLEIELPPFGTLRKSFPFCLVWLGVQIPLCVFVSIACGFGGFFGFVAAAGINACSLGIAFGVTKKSSFEEGTTQKILMAMVVLEVFSLFILGMSEVVYKYGVSFEVFTHGSALIGFILLLRAFSKPIHKRMSKLIEGVGIWKVHQLFLLIFVISMLGDRFGLSAQKTAFFLGLFLPSTTEKGIKMESQLKTVAHGILVPIFFISLGSRISPHNLMVVLPIGMVITVVLFSIRYVIFRFRSNLDIEARNFLLFCPNLTVVAVAAQMLLIHNAHKETVDLLLATGFFMTIGSVILLPTKKVLLVREDPSYQTLDVENLTPEFET